jgi:hypothetical protein
MASTYLNNLRLENIGDGDQSGTWGSTTNKNICGLLVDAVAGITSTSITGLVTYTLSANNGIADESRNAVLRFTGSLAAQCSIIVPATVKTYLVDNQTTGDGPWVGIKTATGLEAIVPPGLYYVYCDGLDSYVSTGFSNGGIIYGNLGVLGDVQIGSATTPKTLNVSGNTTLKPSLTGALVGTAGLISSVAPGASGNVLTSDGTEWVSSTAGFPPTTRLIFQQTAAPIGWTKVTATGNDSVLRIVTGSVVNGGTIGVSTWAAQTATGGHILTIAEMPAHTHDSGAVTGVSGLQGQAAQGYVGQGNTGSTGGGTAHTHTLSQDIKYYDAIVAVKD